MHLLPHLDILQDNTISISSSTLSENIFTQMKSAQEAEGREGKKDGWRRRIMFDQPTELPKPFQISTFIYQVKTRFNFCQKKTFCASENPWIEIFKARWTTSAVPSIERLLHYLSFYDGLEASFIQTRPFLHYLEFEFMSKHTLVNVRRRKITTFQLTNLFLKHTY